MFGVDWPTKEGQIITPNTEKKPYNYEITTSQPQDTLGFARLLSGNLAVISHISTIDRGRHPNRLWTTS